MVLCGERDGGGGAGTVGMDLAVEAELAGRFQIAIETGQQGGVAIPRKIGEVGYPATADLGKQFGHDPFDGVRGPSFEFARQTEKKAGDQVERIAAERPEHAQQLGFGAVIQSAPGLDLHGGGAVARHGFEVSARPDFQALAGGGVQGVHGRGQVRRLDAGRREGQVGVGSRRSRA